MFQSNETLCDNPRIDAAVPTTHDYTYYVFRDSEYWEVNYIDKKVSQTRVISKDWIGLTGQIKAAFSFYRSNSSLTDGIYFFIAVCNK